MGNADETRTIAVAEILTEVNSFSPVKTTRRDFEARCLLYGEEIIPVARKHKFELGGFLAIMEVAETAWKPEFWQELGLNLWKADIIVVKSIYPFRWYCLLYNRKTVFVLTPGTTDFDVFNLKFKNLPRPIFPFDDIDSWRHGA